MLLWMYFKAITKSKIELTLIQTKSYELPHKTGITPIQNIEKIFLANCRITFDKQL